MSEGAVARAGSRLLEAVLVLAMLSVGAYSVVRPLLGPAGFGLGTGPVYGAMPSVSATLAGGIETQPRLPGPGADAVGPGDGIALGEPMTASVTVLDPTVAQRVALVGPRILGGLITLAVLFLLFQVVHSLRQGDPFRRGNAYRLLGIAVLVGVGGQATVLLNAWGHALLWEHRIVAPFVAHDVRISFVPLIAGFGIAVLAEVFRLGTRLRDDVAATV